MVYSRPFVSKAVFERFLNEFEFAEQSTVVGAREKKIKKELGEKRLRYGIQNYFRLPLCGVTLSKIVMYESSMLSKCTLGCSLE